MVDKSRYDSWFSARYCLFGKRKRNANFCLYIHVQLNLYASLPTVIPRTLTSITDITDAEKFRKYRHICKKKNKKISSSTTGVPR